MQDSEVTMSEAGAVGWRLQLQGYWLSHSPLARHDRSGNGPPIIYQAICDRTLQNHNITKVMSRPREPDAEDFDDQDYPAKRQRQRQRHDQDFWQSEHHLLESADLSINTCSEHTTLAISQHEAPFRAAIDPSQTLVPAAEVVLAEEQARSHSLICYGMVRHNGRG